LDLFQRVEAPALRRLPAQPFEPVTWAQAKVARDCHVQVGGALYSIPYQHIGAILDVRISEAKLEFFRAQTLVKTHLPLREGRRSTDWNDYPSEKAAFFMRTPDWCRAQARSLGPGVAEIVAELLSRHALHYLRQCQGIIALADKYTPERLDAACRVATSCGDPAYRTVRNLLEKALEGQSALPWSAGRAEKNAGAFLHGPDQLFDPSITTAERKPDNA
jgi:hypothetical protein